MDTFGLVLVDQGLRYQEVNIYDQDGGTIFGEPKGWKVDLLPRRESTGCEDPPILKTVIQSSAMDYFFMNDPKYRDLFVAKNEEGEEVHYLFLQPKSPDDLCSRDSRMGRGSDLRFFA